MIPESAGVLDTVIGVHGCEVQVCNAKLFYVGQTVRSYECEFQIESIDTTGNILFAASEDVSQKLQRGDLLMIAAGL